jgi:ribonucleoside-diphosphate reductase alpha chain
LEDWDDLREKVAEHGARNSLLVALMPTATTSHIMGSAGEAMEPYTSLLFTRKTLAGEFIVVNRALVRMLDERGLWNEQVKEAIIMAEGSVQGLDDLVPADIQVLFKTVWDLKQKVLLAHARNRSPYVCQSQSTNLFMEAPTRGKVQAALLYGWKAGLKTSIYYLRTKPAARAQRFTIAPKAPVAQVADEMEDEPFCAVCSA